MMRSRLRSILALSFAAAVVACGGADATKKSGLALCDDGDEDCTKAKDNRPKSGQRNDDAPAGPSGEPVLGKEPDEEPTADAGKPDAPADAGPAPSTKLCAALDACCAQLAAQGYDPATCKGVVATKNEDACFAQHDRYKQFGDCS